MKKKGNMIYVGFFFVLCLIPSVGMLLPQTQGSATENRKLAVWPQLRTEYRFPLRGRRIFPGSLWIPSAACHGKCTDKWKNIWCIHSRRRDPGQERLAVL